MAVTSLFICVHHLKKETVREENPNLPDPELILSGVCTQYAVYGIAAPINLGPFCGRNGLGSWAELVIVSGVLAFFSHLKSSV